MSLEQRDQRVKETRLTRAQRLGSACVGAIITSITVTPFDVIKTRQQIEAGQTLCECSCKPFRISTGLLDGELWCYRCKGFTGIKPTSTFGTFLRIAKQEGGWRLWRGLTPTFAQSVPSTVLYFNCYDEMSAFLNSTDFAPNAFIPMLSGVSARIAAATAVSPIELIRTRVMANKASENAVKNIVVDLAKEARHIGPRVLYRGLGPTLWRDVPFSGIYWSFYEQFKFGLLNEIPNDPFTVSFVSGACSGMIASFLTSPFDVIKTRQQVDFIRSIAEEGTARSTMNGTFNMLGKIIQNEGVSALFVGVVPRTTKIAPACAIMISTYEFFKRYVSES